MDKIFDWKMIADSLSICREAQPSERENKMSTADNIFAILYILALVVVVAVILLWH